jgi:hypothetical protein
MELVHLPPEILAIILKRTDKYDVLFVKLTCSYLYNLGDRFCQPLDISDKKNSLCSSVSRLQFTMKHEFLVQWQIVGNAIQVGNIEVLIHLEETGIELKDEAMACSWAPNLEILKFLCQRGCPWDGMVYFNAAKIDDMEMVKWALENGCPKNSYLIKLEEVSELAIQNGNLEMLKLLHNHGFPIPWSGGEHAAYGGYLNILKWIVQNGHPIRREHLSNPAASGGNLEVLQYIRDNIPQARWGKDVCQSAARSQNPLPILKWLRGINCPWDAWTSKELAEKHQFEALKWAVENGCPASGVIADCIAKSGHPDTLLLLQWAHGRGLNPGNDILFNLSKNNNDEAFMWAFENGHLLTDNALDSIVENENIKLLNFLSSKGAPFTSAKACKIAVEKERLDILILLRSKRCPWDSEVFYAAVKSGNLEIVKWLWKNRCPHDGLICKRAIEFRHRKILVWALDEGFDLDGCSIEIAKESFGDDSEIIDQLIARGCY